MQAPRYALALPAFLVFFACAQGPGREPAAASSTASHDAVAGRDGADPGAAGTRGADAARARKEVVGNERVRSFDDAKDALVQMYREGPVKADLYCGCTFVPNAQGAPGGWRRFNVDFASCGYTPYRDAARASRIEWEHAVPAAAFGRTFPEWREGSDACRDHGGRRFKGRKCASRASAEFSRIEADMHNLFPVVGEVNGYRADLPMGVLDAPDSARSGADRATHRNLGSFRFGACESTIDGGVFMPRPEARGELARAYKYMNAAYPERGLIDEAHRALFDRWDTEDPPDAWERRRNELIEQVQGNRNPFIDATAPATSAATRAPG